METEIERLKQENVKLKKQVEDMHKTIMDTKVIIFKIAGTMGLMNEAGTAINERFWPKDGSEGDNPIPTVISAFTDLGASWANTKMIYHGKAKKEKLMQEFKDKVSWVYQIKDIVNSYSHITGMEKIELM